MPRLIAGPRVEKAGTYDGGFVAQQFVPFDAGAILVFGPEQVLEVIPIGVQNLYL